MPAATRPNGTPSKIWCGVELTSHGSTLVGHERPGDSVVAPASAHVGSTSPDGTVGEVRAILAWKLPLTVDPSQRSKDVQGLTVGPSASRYSRMTQFHRDQAYDV